jgi:GNAT superfamily N-acetyltransferase
MSPDLPADLEVRPLRPADADAVAQVTSATDRTYVDWMPEGWKPAEGEAERDHYRKRIGDSTYWGICAFDDRKRMAAFALLRQATDDAGDEPLPGVGHLTALFVSPDRWRQGIAAALLVLCEEEMRRRGYSEGQLRTPADAPAIDFYESQGWARNGQELYLERYDIHTIGFSKSLEA